MCVTDTEVFAQRALEEGKELLRAVQRGSAIASGLRTKNTSELVWRRQMMMIATATRQKEKDLRRLIANYGNDVGWRHAAEGAPVREGELGMADEEKIRDQVELMLLQYADALVLMLQTVIEFQSRLVIARLEGQGEGVTRDAVEKFHDRFFGEWVRVSQIADRFGAAHGLPALGPVAVDEKESVG